MGLLSRAGRTAGRFLRGAGDDIGFNLEPGSFSAPVSSTLVGGGLGGMAGGMASGGDPNSVAMGALGGAALGGGLSLGKLGASAVRGGMEAVQDGAAVDGMVRMSARAIADSIARGMPENAVRQEIAAASQRLGPQGTQQLMQMVEEILQSAPQGFRR